MILRVNASGHTPSMFLTRLTWDLKEDGFPALERG